MKKKLPKATNYCCIIDNKERTFNYIDKENVLSLNYCINNKDELHANMFKGIILRELISNCICDNEYLSFCYKNYNYWTIKYNDKYMFFDGKKVEYCKYPAFFVKIQCSVEPMGYIELVNIKSTVLTLIDTLKPFFEKSGIYIEKISVEPCFEHAQLYSNNKKAFELLFNDKCNESDMIFMDVKQYLGNFEFKFFEY